MIFEMDKTTVEDVRRVITSDKFVQFLLSETTQFAAAAWILQTLNEKIDEIEEALS